MPFEARTLLHRRAWYQTAEQVSSCVHLPAISALDSSLPCISFPFKNKRKTNALSSSEKGHFLLILRAVQVQDSVYIQGRGWGIQNRVQTDVKYRKRNASHCFQPAPGTSARWLLSVPVKRSHVWEWKPWCWSAGWWREMQKSWLGILPLDLRYCVVVCFLGFLAVCLLIAAIPLSLLFFVLTSSKDEMSTLFKIFRDVHVGHQKALPRLGWCPLTPLGVCAGLRGRAPKEPHLLPSWTHILSLSCLCSSSKILGPHERLRGCDERGNWEKCSSEPCIPGLVLISLCSAVMDLFVYMNSLMYNVQ